ncbi:MAG: YesN/AraC family two-component response regulator [Halieaceae bacterium]|jgi:YesN/AraC family two-component response regulator
MNDTTVDKIDPYNMLVEEIEGLKILLVDDEEFVISVIEQILSDFGFENIRCAANGKEALEIINSEKIDLLLTDIQMPMMNGLELLKQIRSGHTKAPRGLLTIVVTSLDNPESFGSAMSLDVNAFLTKPFKRLTIMKKIVQALADNNFQLRDERDYEGIDVVLGRTEVEVVSPESEADYGVQTTDRIVLLHELESGMCLAANVVTNNGVLVLAKGFMLSKTTIRRLHELGEGFVGKEYLISQSD